MAKVAPPEISTVAKKFDVVGRKDFVEYQSFLFEKLDTVQTTLSNILDFAKDRERAAEETRIERGNQVPPGMPVSVPEQPEKKKDILDNYGGILAAGAAAIGIAIGAGIKKLEEEVEGVKQSITAWYESVTESVFGPLRKMFGIEGDVAERANQIGTSDELPDLNFDNMEQELENELSKVEAGIEPVQSGGKPADAPAGGGLPTVAPVIAPAPASAPRATPTPAPGAAGPRSATPRSIGGAPVKSGSSLSPSGGNIPSAGLPTNEKPATAVAQAGPGFTTVVTNDGEMQRREGVRNWRNNNPGNIEYGKFAESMGAIGSDGRFAVFPTLEAGNKAKEHLLFGPNSRYVNLSIGDAINRYAPPSENNTGMYINAVTSATGVPASMPLSKLSGEQRGKFLAAINRVEGFRPGKILAVNGPPGQMQVASAPQAEAARSVAAAPPAMTVAAKQPAIQSIDASKTQVVNNQTAANSQDTGQTILSARNNDPVLTAYNRIAWSAAGDA